MTKPSPTSERIAWAIEARARSQRLLLALYDFGERKDYGLAERTLDPERGDTQVFSLLVGVAFSLWRAAFLADMQTRTWAEALRDAQQLLGKVLTTNTIASATEHDLQGWGGGYYLTNAKLRLQDVARRLRRMGQASDDDVERLGGLSVINADPHDTWKQLCDEAERLAGQIGCGRT